MDDYDRSNPVTSKEATLQHLDALSANEKSEDKLAKLKIQRLLVEQGGDFGSLKKYADGEKSLANKAIDMFKKNIGFKVPPVVEKMEKVKDSDNCIEGEQNSLVKTGFLPPINQRRVVPLQRIEELDIEDERKNDTNLVFETDKRNLNTEIVDSPNELNYTFERNKPLSDEED
jgi:hypothetical protein